jgi:tRNA dimethylallyltransferase
MPTLPTALPDFPPEWRPILIAGPTASGKSALAVALAEQFDGCVINADALQVYAEWHLLTARPGERDMARAPHRLYGHIPAGQGHSAGAWLRELSGVLAGCAAKGWRPVIVGGTGLYFKALTEGLAEIPETPQTIRAAADARFAEGGRDALVGDLAGADPETLAAIDAQNSARLMRAWEVLETTGRGLAAWQRETPPPLLRPEQCIRLRLMPDRALLYERIAGRLDAMLAEGVLDEVASVAQLELPPSSPALKAVGAREFMDHLRGALTLEAARSAAVTATRRYAKRQMTWARNQMMSWQAITAQESSEILAIATDHVRSGP